MKKMLVAIAVVCAALAVAVPVSLAKETTTAPGYNFYIGVYINKNGGVVLTRSVARRGWLAHFIVHNGSAKVVRFEIGGLKTPPIKPGKKSRLGAQLENRGQYEYKVDNQRRGFFTVI
jgi:hypothetical protein